MPDQLGIIQSLASIYAALYESIFPTTNSVHESLPQLFHGYEVGMQTGDLEFACLNIGLYCMVTFSAGVALDDIQMGAFLAVDGLA